MGIKITCDHYKDDDTFIVFVNGFALNRNSCSYQVAYNLAKAAGQSELETKVFHDNERPIPYIIKDIIA